MIMPPSKRKSLTMDAIISQKCQNKENSSIISPTVTISSPSTDLISATSSNTRSCDDSSEPQQIPDIAMYKRSDLPPPDGITQEQYNELLNNRGCQFCNKSRIRKIYWVFRIRCCGNCFKSKTTRGDSIVSSVPSDLICALPFHQEKGVKFYWSSMVDAYVKEYESIPIESRSDWLKQKYDLVRLIMADVEIRTQADSDERKAMVEIRDQNSTLRKEAIAQYLRELLDEKSDDGTSKYLEKYVLECPSYQNAIQQKTPFTEKKWSLLKGKLINEYQTVLAKHKGENMDSDYEVNSPDATLPRIIDHKSNEMVDFKSMIGLSETDDDHYLVPQIPDQSLNKSCNTDLSKFSPSITIDQKTEDICIEEQQLLATCDNQNTANTCIEAQRSLLDQYMERDAQQPTSEIDTDTNCTDVLLNENDDSDTICQNVDSGSNEHFKWRMIPFSPDTMNTIEATRESWKKQGAFEHGQPPEFEPKECVSSQIYGQMNMSADQPFWLNDLYMSDNLTPDQIIWSSEGTSPAKYGIPDEFLFSMNQNIQMQQKSNNQQPTAPTTPISWSVMNSVTDSSVQQSTSLPWHRQEILSFDIFQAGNVTCPAFWQAWIEKQLQQVHASEYFTSDRMHQIQLLSQQMYIIEKIRALLPRHTPLLLEQGITSLPTIASNLTFTSGSQYSHHNEYSQTRSVINLLRFLRWCPSFSDPPVQYNYPYQPWDERFVDEVLIPILSTEAVVFLRNPAHTVKGAVLRGLANTGLFRCKLCWFWAKVPSYNYEYVRKHLMEFHKSEPLDELMEILVEYLPNNLDIPIDTKLWWELTKMSGKLD